MTLVIIQIPCFNEEAVLPTTLAGLPRILPGVDRVEWLVIDDGCTDDTVRVARDSGVDHIVRHRVNKGLAAAFQTGINACLQLGADIIVNTDADNQYPPEYIPALIAPILQYRAEMVIGDRQTDSIRQFSPSKRLLQKMGSSVVRLVSGIVVPDAPSGFRALSREAALRITVMSGYSYTLETIIQAGAKNLSTTHVPITINLPLRESRLVRSNWDYVLRSGLTILRMFVLYQPLRFFSWLAAISGMIGTAFWLRYAMLWVLGSAPRGAYVQSVIVGAVFIILTFVLFMMGLLGDLIAINRRLQEETLYYVKRSAFSGGEEIQAAEPKALQAVREP